MFKEDAANKTGESLKGNSASVELCGYGGKERRIGQSSLSPFYQSLIVLVARRPVYRAHLDLYRLLCTFYHVNGRNLTLRASDGAVIGQ